MTEAEQAEVAELRDQVTVLKEYLRVEKLKNQHSLANNLCPDHRDKQQGKPCLACTIEKLGRAFKSIYTILGWMNEPPLSMIEAELCEMKRRLAAKE